MIRGNKLVTLLLFLNVEDLIFDIQQSIFVVERKPVSCRYWCRYWRVKWVAIQRKRRGSEVIGLYLYHSKREGQKFIYS